MDQSGQMREKDATKQDKLRAKVALVKVERRRETPAEGGVYTQSALGPGRVGKGLEDHEKGVCSVTV